VADLDFDSWTCPVPLRSYATIVLGHGGGGQLSAELIQHLIVPAFGTDHDVDGAAVALGDSAVVPVPGLEVPGARLAMTTDSYVVRPLFFPGGSIGELAVHGTINDLAMSGATPLYLTCGLILEEGTSMEVVGRIVAAMGAAATAAGVRIVTGDTKVVDAGHGDGVFVNTSGIGVVAPGLSIGPDRARPGDVVIVSGPIGLHGIAILSVREGISFGTEVASDTAPLHGLVQTLLAAAPGVRALRDPTRGGLGATLHEIAGASRVGVQIDEATVPVPPAVANACALLGLDPWYVANEGKLVAIVPAEQAEAALAALQVHEFGGGATVIGRIVDDHPGLVVARTPYGTSRVVDLPLGEQLPRIC